MWGGWVVRVEEREGERDVDIFEVGGWGLEVVSERLRWDCGLGC